MITPLGRFVLGTARLYRLCSRTPVDLVVILQRGHYLEKAEAPERRPFRRRYNKSFPNHLGMDAGRNSGGIRREKPRCEADRPGQSVPCSHTRPITSSSQAIGRSRRPSISSCKPHHTRKLERGRHFLRPVLSLIDNPWLAHYSRRS